MGGGVAMELSLLTKYDCLGLILLNSIKYTGISNIKVNSIKEI
jgi:hypothetical protein